MTYAQQPLVAPTAALTAPDPTDTAALAAPDPTDTAAVAAAAAARASHRLHLLFAERLARSTRPFLARGGRVVRCPLCRLALPHCICPDNRPPAASPAGFALLFHDDEILKPSNSGKLIADRICDTWGFIWQRGVADESLLQLLAEPQWAPFLVFPATYAGPERQVYEQLPPLPTGKRPLFVLIDGSWREACKIFRKSPWLEQLPLLSFSPQQLSRYGLREASRPEQLATAEVAARLLAMAGDDTNARLLDGWFDLFSYRYQRAVHQPNEGNADALRHWQLLVNSPQP